MTEKANPQSETESQSTPVAGERASTQGNVASDSHSPSEWKRLCDEAASYRIKAREHAEALEKSTAKYAKLKSDYEALKATSESAFLRQYAQAELARAGVTDPDILDGLTHVALSKSNARIGEGFKVESDVSIADIVKDLASKVTQPSQAPVNPPVQIATRPGPVEAPLPDPRNWRSAGGSLGSLKR